MKKIVRGMGSVLLGLAMLPATGAAADSSCVACHKTVDAPAYVEHNFKDWESSVHARAGVGCESCHGGDPAASEKAKAHAGVIRSTAKNSPLYYTAIPESCGSCHQPELKAFKASVHYKQLHRTGHGPNCLTCHGSMASHVLAPRDMEMTCTLCHRRPTQAYVARLGLDEAASAVKRLEKAVHQAKAAGTASEGQERAYEEIAKLQRDASADWHAFDMPKAIETAARIRVRAAAALDEPGVKPKPTLP